MKWDKPKPLAPSVVWSALENETLVPSKNDPAFSDFNLPLLEQEVVGGVGHVATETEASAKKDCKALTLRGWDI